MRPRTALRRAVMRARDFADYRVRQRIVAPLLRLPSRMWYGNDAGWRHNRDRGAGALDPRAMALHRLGFLRMPDYDVALAKTIAVRVQALHEQGLRYRVGTGSYRVLDFLGSVPEARALLTDTMREILTAYYGGGFRVYSVVSWRNEHVQANPRHEVYSDFWHCDNAPVSLVKFYVNLSDVRADTGAFRFHPIPSTREIMHAGYCSRWRIFGPARRMVDDPARMVIFEGAPGSATFCNTELCLHRASIPKAGAHRDIIEIKFEPSSTPMPAAWWTTVTPDDAEQRALGARRREGRR